MHIPNHPEDHEKYLYISHHQQFLTLFSIISFAGIMYSSYRFFGTDPRLYIFYPFLFFTFVYYSISTFIQGFGKPFDHQAFRQTVEAWKPKIYPTVDIFLPVCGEDLRILQNTWTGIQNLQKNYRGKVIPYVLDDCDNDEAKKLAKRYGFTYLVRNDRGHFKKAGNLRFGFNNSTSEYIAIFDADFRPRPDFLDELLPSFDQNPKLGIVQSPQYFDVHAKQNWIERGAGAVQEYFYRSIQQNRQVHNGAICVGSNAVYKREALATNGGTTLIEHSEDVHTGFDLRKNGWELLYVPIILAKGTCPSDLKGFFHQQYRWCKGSMSLLSSAKFWTTIMPIRSRLCYLTGFLYYIHTAIYTIIGPLVPLALLLVVPNQARLTNYIPLIPAIIYNTIIFPLWHKTKYRFETLSTKLVYGWAHLFAIIDSLIGRGMEWHPTGSPHSKSNHFLVFRFSVVIFSLTTALSWVGTSFWYMVHWNFLNFAPIFASGVIYLIVISRIVFTSITLSDSRLTPKKSLALSSFISIIFISLSTVYTIQGKLSPVTPTQTIAKITLPATPAPLAKSPQPTGVVLGKKTSNPPVTSYFVTAPKGLRLRSCAGLHCPIEKILPYRAKIGILHISTPQDGYNWAQTADGKFVALNFLSTKPPLIAKSPPRPARLTPIRSLSGTVTATSPIPARTCPSPNCQTTSIYGPRASIHINKQVAILEHACYRWAFTREGSYVAFEKTDGTARYIVNGQLLFVPRVVTSITSRGLTLRLCPSPDCQIVRSLPNHVQLVMNATTAPLKSQGWTWGMSADGYYVALQTISGSHSLIRETLPPF